MKPKRWHRSDLFPVTLSMLLASALCLLGGVWFGAFLLAAIGIGIGSIDRSEAYGEGTLDDLTTPEERERARTLLDETEKASFLHPDNIPSYKDPPDIG